MNYGNVIAIQNIGNSCYLNSAIQCILSSDLFCTNILNFPFDKKNVDILRILKEFIIIKKSDSKILINPNILKFIMSNYSSFFKGYNQQDCHECIITILDIIHEQTKNINFTLDKSLFCSKIVDKRESEKYWAKHNNIFGKSFVSDIFNLQIRSSLICQCCGNSRSNYETANNISLSLPNSEKIDIIDCFNNYFKSEILDGSNAVMCDKCKKNTKTVKSLDICRFPKIMIIHMKRYTQNTDSTYSRNNCLVDYFSSLKFVCKDAGIEYELKSVVNHFGNNPQGGHYTICTKMNKEWVHIDDSSVYKIEESKICSPSAYVLFMVRI